MGPDEILTERRRAQQARTVALPPKGRSPIKTALGSSPRRQSSVAPASILRNSTETPDHASSSQRGVNRRLDFQASEPRQSIEGIDEEDEEGYDDELGTGQQVSSPAQRTIRIPRPERPDVFDLRPSPEQGDDGGIENGIDQESEEITENQPLGEQESYLVNGVDSHSLDDAEEPLPDEEPNTTLRNSLSRSELTNTSFEGSRRKGRSRKSDVDSSLIQPDSATRSAKARSEANPTGITAKSAAKKGARQTEEVENSSSEIRTRKKKGRKRKGSPAPVENSIIIDDVNGDSALHEPAPPAKGKRRGREGNESEDAPPQKRKKQSMPPPAKRDPNARISGVKGKKQQGNGLIGDSKYRADEVPTRPKSTHIIRQGTPMDEPGAHVTRYGRASIKPLAWYRGEGIRWSQRSSRDELPGVEEVVRIEDILPLPIKRSKKSGRKPKSGAMSTVDEDEEEQLEPWEQDSGFVLGTTHVWDSLEDDIANEDEDTCKFFCFLGTGHDAMPAKVHMALIRDLGYLLSVNFFRSTDVGFAQRALQPREVPGANFRLAKCLTLDFFGAGIVELPPMGFKKTKNARRMHMVFFVHTGKVHVEVANKEFNISKGGIWQVPRGALLFFILVIWTIRTYQLLYSFHYTWFQL